METFLYSLLMSAIAGLTFIAYKHPKGYDRMFNYLYGFAFLIYAVAASWNFSSILFWSKIKYELTDEQIKIIEPIFDSYQMPSLKFNLIYFGVLAYLIFLNQLPRLLEHEK